MVEECRKGVCLWFVLKMLTDEQMENILSYLQPRCFQRDVNVINASSQTINLVPLSEEQGGMVERLRTETATISNAIASEVRQSLPTSILRWVRIECVALSAICLPLSRMAPRLRAPRGGTTDRSRERADQTESSSRESIYEFQVHFARRGRGDCTSRNLSRFLWNDSDFSKSFLQVGFERRRESFRHGSRKISERWLSSNMARRIKALQVWRVCNRRRD